MPYNEDFLSFRTFRTSGLTEDKPVDGAPANRMRTIQGGRPNGEFPSTLTMQSTMCFPRCQGVEIKYRIPECKTSPGSNASPLRVVK
jgi:hypothetical protein